MFFAIYSVTTAQFILKQNVRPYFPSASIASCADNFRPPILSNKYRDSMSVGAVGFTGRYRTVAHTSTCDRVYQQNQACPKCPK